MSQKSLTLQKLTSKVFEEGVLGLDLVRRYQILQHVVFNGTVSGSWRNVSWTENYFCDQDRVGHQLPKMPHKNFHSLSHLFTIILAGKNKVISRLSIHTLGQH